MKSSSWFPSEFPLLKVGFHVEEVLNALYMEILMEYDDGDVVQVDLMESGRAGGDGRWTRMHELWGSICRLDSDHLFLPLHPAPHASDPATTRCCCSILRLPGDASAC